MVRAALRGMTPHSASASAKPASKASACAISASSEKTAGISAEEAMRAWIREGIGHSLEQASAGSRRLDGSGRELQAHAHRAAILNPERASVRRRRALG